MATAKPAPAERFQIDERVTTAMREQVEARDRYTKCQTTLRRISDRIARLEISSLPYDHLYSGPAPEAVLARAKDLTQLKNDQVRYQAELIAAAELVTGFPETREMIAAEEKRARVHYSAAWAVNCRRLSVALEEARAAFLGLKATQAQVEACLQELYGADDPNASWSSTRWQMYWPLPSVREPLMNHGADPSLLQRWQSDATKAGFLDGAVIPDVKVHDNAPNTNKMTTYRRDDFVSRAIPTGGVVRIARD